MADINEEFPTLDDLNPDNDALPQPSPRTHGKSDDHVDDDALALATEREEVALGLKNYVPDDVPDATDPLPEEAAPDADLAQRGLLGDPDGT
ncbi:hypothetical protein FJV46_07330 [Arthrobacter agilis]|uniref:hypothetical protein n=1 Tax=Arthrobacter agilis TaxID=37921 RepID=UPI000B35AC65|nr:hypothetical protein [Arthrobacter agilis]OUM42965.1 hypothetical protein B8W74_06860 [Arthrobacter agilis]PPB45910.1 hypothetical protein CI784_09055 [Arthrobacter agilis]TPV25451.1 hypothetical protein FJV46_07330 [Arthrobacter agilis]VDR33192.1 Uncharacterised protein [Arthrobacter agilis]